MLRVMNGHGPAQVGARRRAPRGISAALKARWASPSGFVYDTACCIRRGHEQRYRSNEGGTLVGGKVKFDGLVLSQETLIGIPLQWWLKLGRRSALTINVEPGLTVWRNASDEGERSITSWVGHPDGSVSTSTWKEPYERALASRTGSAMGVLALGYRRWLGDRMCAGADAGVSGPLSGQGWAGGPVTEVALMLGWAIRDGVNKPVNQPD